MRARRLRREIADGPNAVRLPREEVVRRLVPAPGELPLDATDRDLEGIGDPVDVAQDLLVQHGMRAVPPLTDVDAGETVEVRRTRTPAFQGAFILGAIATLVGGALFWAYGLAMAVATVVALAVLATRFERADRAAPSFIPRGRLFGAAIAGAVLALAVVVAVIPVWAARRSDDSGAQRARAAAEAAIAAARTESEAGRFPQALEQLAAASRLDPSAPGLEEARVRLNVAWTESLLAERDRKIGVYERARRAAADGRYAAAIRLLRSIAGFRDADALVDEYRAARRSAGGIE